MEELKAILGAIENLGEMGAWLFGGYLLKQLIVNFLVGGIVVYIANRLFIIVKFLWRATRTLRDIRDMWGIGCEGQLIESEINKIFERAVELSKKANQ
jgi:hypothetical protein